MAIAPRRRRCITLPPIGTPTPPPPIAELPTQPGRDARPDRGASTSTCRSSRAQPGYPPCDVAMYLRPRPSRARQPGQGRATYICTRTPDRACSCRCSGPRHPAEAASIVEVWTSDDQLFRYEIVAVRRGQTEPRRSADREVPSSSGCRPPRARRARSARPRSSPCRCPSSPPTPADAHPKRQAARTC